jgi:hypothetical protein
MVTQYQHLLIVVLAVALFLALVEVALLLLQEEQFLPYK